MRRYLQVEINRPLDRSFEYYYEGDISNELLLGSRVKITFSGKKILGFVVGIRSTSEYDSDKIVEIGAVYDDNPLFSESQLALGKWLAHYYFCSWGEALFCMAPGAKKERALDVTWEASPKEYQKLTEDEKKSRLGSHIVFSSEQENAISCLQNSKGGAFYLYGITGSGKSIVYFELIKQQLLANRQVLYLLPEITLIYQVLKQIQEYFKDNNEISLNVAVLHSNLTPAQKMKEWRRIQRNDANVIIGARSAVFAPVVNLGAIIIDEEHENSYKSSQKPRYHARQVAMKRYQKSENCFLLLGSATPAIESYNYMKSGYFTRLDLPSRVGDGKRPIPVVVNMQGVKECLSPFLKQRLLEVTKNNHQTILFLNRRGHSYYFHCQSCGYEMLCEDCSVSLTYHQKKNVMMCHYCGKHKAPIRVCPECHSYDMVYAGVGIEQVEQEVIQLLGPEKVARLDTDVAVDRKYVSRILGEFHEGKLSVLIGTQMIAKGLNFPQVKLVGLVMADASLNLPDFRAAERAFSLIQQVSGRAGRYRDDGEVIVQTYQPDSSIIQWATQYENAVFYEQESLLREQLFYPPSTRLIRLVIRGEKEERVKQELEIISQLFIEWGVDFLGPVECPIARIARNYRGHILLKTSEFQKTHGVVQHLLKHYKPPVKYFLEVDIDPVSIL